MNRAMATILLFALFLIGVQIGVAAEFYLNKYDICNDYFLEMGTWECMKTPMATLQSLVEQQ